MADYPGVDLSDFTRSRAPRPQSVDDLIDNSTCVHPRCEKPPQERFSFPLPLCQRHLLQVLVKAGEIAREAKTEFVAINSGKKMPVDTKAGLHHEPLIYYVRFGDRVKIGTSTNLSTRLRTIPHDEFLGTEPGGAEVERARHAKFARDRISGEWFEMSAELMDHIAGLCYSP